MIKKIFKSLLILSIFLQNSIFAMQNEYIAFIDTEPSRELTYDISNGISSKEEEMLISLMESIMNSEIEAFDSKVNFVRFPHYDDALDINYKLSVKRAYQYIKGCFNYVHDCLKDKEGIYLSLFLYIQSLRFLDFVYVLDLDSDHPNKLFLQEFRKDLIKAFGCNDSFEINVNTALHYSNYTPIKNIMFNIDYINKNISHMLREDMTQKRLKAIESYKKDESNKKINKVIVLFQIFGINHTNPTNDPQ